jgi:hypothetical protein
MSGRDKSSAIGRQMTVVAIIRVNRTRSALGQLRVTAIATNKIASADQAQGARHRCNSDASRDCETQRLLATEHSPHGDRRGLNPSHDIRSMIRIEKGSEHAPLFGGRFGRLLNNL